MFTKFTPSWRQKVTIAIKINLLPGKMHSKCQGDLSLPDGEVQSRLPGVSSKIQLHVGPEKGLNLHDTLYVLLVHFLFSNSNLVTPI